MFACIKQSTRSSINFEEKPTVPYHRLHQHVLKINAWRRLLKRVPRMRLLTLGTIRLRSIQHPFLASPVTMGVHCTCVLFSFALASSNLTIFSFANLALFEPVRVLQDGVVELVQRYGVQELVSTLLTCPSAHRYLDFPKSHHPQHERQLPHRSQRVETAFQNPPDPDRNLV